MEERTTFILATGNGGVRPIPEPTFYPPGTPIDTMLEAPIYGNAYSDGPLNVALLKYAVETENPMNKRRAAIAKIDAIVGLPKPPGSDEHVVIKFMEEMAQYVDEIRGSKTDEMNPLDAELKKVDS